MLINKKFKASSLSNAIYVCIMISILSACLVLISHYQNLLNIKLEFTEKLINVNEATSLLFSQNMGEKQYFNLYETDIFDNNILSISERKKWGFYDIMNIKTIHGNDTLSKSYLTSKSGSHDSNPILYLTDYDKVLKIGGESKIRGKSIVPLGSIDLSFTSNQIKNNVEISGLKLKSKDKLPKLKVNTDIDVNKFELKSIESIVTKTIINSFSNETLVFDITGIPVLSGYTIKGNIILFSNNNISISDDNAIEDILIIADKVKFASYFSGNAQIIAKKEVILEENTLLRYPSSIYAENDTDSINIYLKSKAKLAGSIILDGKSYEGSLKRKLIIDNGAKVYGSVYNYGKTQLQGEIVGEIYTDRFFLKTKTQDYENIIVDGIISKENLPDGFVQLPLIDTLNINRYEIIKEF